MTSLNLSYLLKSLSPNRVTLEDKASTYGFGKHTIQSITVSQQSTQKIPKCRGQFYSLKQHFRNVLFLTIEPFVQNKFYKEVQYIVQKQMRD